MMSNPPQPLGNQVAQIFTRHDWGALPPRKKLRGLSTPITKVVSTWANVDPCRTVEECKKRVREVQRRHMELWDKDDIEHNFLVGGDGNIYEGRGWYNVGPRYPLSLAYASDLNEKSVEIAFIQHEPKKPDEIQTRAVSDCVAYGLIAKYLQEKVQFYWRTPDEIQYVSSYQKGTWTEEGPGDQGFGITSIPKTQPGKRISIALGSELPKD